ncbi:MAG: 3-hydroxyacyl-CoA dehydrogenase, partial [Acidobacteria bacterium]|nr:3-hydroxyacyl-CoA dehydrogenase [Acidobacteriota bacterium]
MARKIRKAAVLGSGVMGSGIAAHLANAGIPVLLLDIVPRQLTPEDEARGLTLEDPRFRNQIVAKGFEALKSSRPAALYSQRFLPLIEIGNFEDDWHRLAECDWIVEVVVERLDIKRQVMERIDAVRKPGSIVSSNTSGLSLAAMAQGRSEDFRRHFLVTHFFNPVR